MLCCGVLCTGYTWDGVIHKMSDKQWGAMLDVHVSGEEAVIACMCVSSPGSVRALLCGVCKRRRTLAGNCSAPATAAAVGVCCVTFFCCLTLSNARVSCCSLPPPPPAAPFKLIRGLSPLFRDAAKAEQESAGAASRRCIINISSTSGTHGNSGQVCVGMCWNTG
jgi:NAD(P)-dependent dehydrogenase (short-subunit alcohol dehydrogenase family)